MSNETNVAAPVSDAAESEAFEAVVEADAVPAVPEPRAKATKPEASVPNPNDYRAKLQSLRKELVALEEAAAPARPDPDRFLMMAKELVVNNYNEHRPIKNAPALAMDAVYIVWFSKTLGNWKAIVSSPVIRGLLWEVSFNGHRREAYIDVYKKLNNVKVQLEEAP